MPANTRRRGLNHHSTKHRFQHIIGNDKEVKMSQTLMVKGGERLHTLRGKKKNMYIKYKLKNVLVPHFS